MEAGAVLSDMDAAVPHQHEPGEGVVKRPHAGIVSAFFRQPLDDVAGKADEPAGLACGASKKGKRIDVRRVRRAT